MQDMLTQKDVTEWCSTHSCTGDNCKYMDIYCHIREFITDECNNCVDISCKKCRKYK